MISEFLNAIKQIKYNGSKVNVIARLDFKLAYFEAARGCARGVMVIVVVNGHGEGLVNMYFKHLLLRDTLI